MLELFGAVFLELNGTFFELLYVAAAAPAGVVAGQGYYRIAYMTCDGAK